MASFQMIYEEYAQPVYRFLLSLSGNADLAEELLQETFYRALLHIDQFEGHCSLYTWLCQIAKNAWLKEVQRKNRYNEVSLDELNTGSDETSLEAHMIARDEYRLVITAIKSLTSPYKDVFILHAIGRIKLKEIAAIYKKSESWARVTYFRAKQQIIQEVSK